MQLFVFGKNTPIDVSAGQIGIKSSKK